VKTYKRVCLEEYVVRADNGDVLRLERGKEYTTSPRRAPTEYDRKFVLDGIDSVVTVFSSYWVPVPTGLFSGSRVFTEGEPGTEPSRNWSA
jgi:hypothetical protein